MLYSKLSFTPRATWLLLVCLLAGSVCMAQTKAKKPVAAAPVATTEILTNASVIDLHKAGLSDDLVIAKITATSAKFDVSTTSLIEFKKQGLSDRLIGAVVDKASGVKQAAPAAVAPVPVKTSVSASTAIPSIDLINNPAYYDKTTGKAMELEFQVAEPKVRMTVGSWLTPNGTPLPARLVVKKAKSPVVFTASPGISFIVNCGTTTTPDIVFGLYRFSTIKKDSRETAWVKVGNKTNTYYLDDDIIGFNYKKLKEGVYEIIPVTPLAVGEYCFVNRVSYASHQEQKADVFAFCIN